MPTGLSKEEEVAIIGNIAVDHAATEALAAHPEFDKENQAEAKSNTALQRMCASWQHWHYQNGKECQKLASTSTGKKC